jgi:FkbM family methyltransferase
MSTNWSPAEVRTKRRASRSMGLSMNRKLVYDVGFNIGQDTAFYLSRGYRVIAIEADPTLAELGRQRFYRDVQEGNLEIVNVGIAEQEGTADFWICESKPEFNSFHQGIASRDGYSNHSIQIPTARFASVLKRYGTPYFLKIDIEGNEMLCLNDLQAPTLPKYIAIESECPVDDQPRGAADGLRVLRKLRDLGYESFKLIDQFTHCSISSPHSLNYLMDSASRRWLIHPPLNRLRGTHRLSQALMTKPKLEKRLGWTFPVGSSGALGEDTAGNWISFEAAQRAYERHRETYFRKPGVTHHSFWCDWHARLNTSPMPDVARASSAHSRAR